jgi:membrane dipeptidase
MRRLLLLFALITACKTNYDEQAKTLAQKLIIADGHVDLPYRLWESKNAAGEITEDISQRTPKGQFDFVRAREGGLDAPFMSIYIPSSFQTGGGAKQLADQLIDMVETFPKRWPDKFAITRSPDEVRAASAAGKIALPLGIENGAAIENDLANLKHFYDRGVRYITLTHSKDNLICDSSFDKTRTHGGLSAFGKEVVAEMNRLGIMIDVSHLSDDTIRQVLELSKAPVVATHSSCRHFTPGFERNLSDELIQAIAKKGGVVLINFGSGFLSAESNADFDKRINAARKYMADNQLAREDPKVEAFIEEYNKEHPAVLAKLDDVVAHIEHVIKLVGVDHVGFGSDFDGVGETLPRGLEDVSKYPAILRALLEKNHNEAELEKICSGNLFRVWTQSSKAANTSL